MFPIIRTATILLALLSLLTGVIYPVTVTLIAQAVFPRQANGSLLEKRADPAPATPQQNSRDGQSDPSHHGPYLGSELIGQPFSDPKYFWGRPSSTAPVAYNGLGGSGSNLAPTNPALTDAIRERIAKLRAEDAENHLPVPVDLVTASASGLDPHISEAAALYQVNRIARVRMIESRAVDRLVHEHLELPTIGLIGQKRVNVLKLNLALDEMTSVSAATGPEK